MWGVWTAESYEVVTCRENRPRPRAPSSRRKPGPRLARHQPFFVIPAKAGIHPGFARADGTRQHYECERTGALSARKGLKRQLTLQLRQRQAAMADAIFEFRIELRRRQSLLDIEEHRVVTEAAIAAALVQHA